MPSKECMEHVGCIPFFKDGKRIFPSLDKVVLDFNIIYHTPTRDEFCTNLKQQLILYENSPSDWRINPTATATDML